MQAVRGDKRNRDLNLKIVPYIVLISLPLLCIHPLGLVIRRTFGLALTCVDRLTSHSTQTQPGISRLQKPSA